MRVWYLPYDDWLRDATVSNRAVNLFFPDKNTKQKQKKEPKKVPANDECTSCFVINSFITICFYLGGTH